MRDGSSDVCSSDLCGRCLPKVAGMRVQKSGSLPGRATPGYRCPVCGLVRSAPRLDAYIANTDPTQGPYGVIIQRMMRKDAADVLAPPRPAVRSEEPRVGNERCSTASSRWSPSP